MAPPIDRVNTLVVRLAGLVGSFMGASSDNSSNVTPYFTLYSFSEPHPRDRDLASRHSLMLIGIFSYGEPFFRTDH